jgi:hypothetical protein
LELKILNTYLSQVVVALVEIQGVAAALVVI